MKKFLIIVVVLISVFNNNVMAQEKPRKTILLDSVYINTFLRTKSFLPTVKGTFLFAGKKSEIINLDPGSMNVADKTARQIFAKVPGIFVYDMDGAGNQINISSRGLDPHRGWEFNIRKDGVLTNTDMYGYPASHFSMPVESVERVELVRGTGSLQYGAQFGGMLNYVTKQGDTTRAFGFENITTIGSFGLVNTYNAIGGKVGKFKYYAYENRKSRNGYRDVEHTDSHNESLALTYEPSTAFSVKLEWARSKYTYRLPGPLNDKMFMDNPRQATRSRNYYSPDIHVPAVTVNWQLNNLTKIQLTSSAVLGTRSSVQFDKPTNIPDTINALTLQYNNRQVDIDTYHSYTTELRLLRQYRTCNQLSSFVGGLQYMNNDLHRRQQGVGTTSSDFDLTLTKPGWGRDIHLKTRNLAFFAENNFQLTSRFSLNAGARVEMGDTRLSGIVSYLPDTDLPLTIPHHFPLFGGGFSYKANKYGEVYGGVSQAYHPMIFKDLVPSSLYEKVNPDIRDADGYNAELGYRGSYKFLSWDVTGYLLQQNNRFGTTIQTDDNNQLYTYRTNIGNSLSKGLEIFVQGNWVLSNHATLVIFNSSAIMDSKYTSGMLKNGSDNVSIKGNKVESAPDLISRTGVSARLGKMSLSGLFSYTSKTFADALNTVIPAPNTGAVGLVPSYGLFDFNASYRVSPKLEFRVGSNNITNKQYFSKRPSFYPGPGIWPSEGRSFNASVAMRL